MNHFNNLYTADHLGFIKLYFVTNITIWYFYLNSMMSRKKNASWKGNLPAGPRP